MYHYTIKQSFIYTESNLKTVLFQTIQFRISMQFSSIWPIDRTLSGATTLGQSGPRSDGSKEILRIPQNVSLTWASPSDCLMSYPGHSLGKFYPSADMQSVYSIAPADWARFCRRILLDKILFPLQNQYKNNFK